MRMNIYSFNHGYNNINIKKLVIGYYINFFSFFPDLLYKVFLPFFRGAGLRFAGGGFAGGCVGEESFSR